EKAGISARGIARCLQPGDVMSEESLADTKLPPVQEEHTDQRGQIRTLPAADCHLQAPCQTWHSVHNRRFRRSPPKGRIGNTTEQIHWCHLSLLDSQQAIRF